MANPDFPLDLRKHARFGGVLYLFVIAAAFSGETFVRGRLISRCFATANNILGSEILFRVGLAAEMLTCLCDVAIGRDLVRLLKPLDRYLALLAAFFRRTFVGLYGVAKLFEIAALVALSRSADYLKAAARPGLHVAPHP